MANISSYLQKIMNAIYGEEVRGSIYDALVAMNTESTNAMQYASAARDSAQAFAASANDSALAAAQKASDANSSARNAAESEESAKTSEENALSAKDVAVQMKTAAIDAKDAAVTAKTAAEQAKTDAVNAKNAAATSAETAQHKAEEAADSERAAKEYSGKPARPDPTTKTWWIWDAESGEYVDSHIGSEIEGPQGVSVTDIVLVSGNHSPGSTDTYEVVLSNGNKHRISVWNGRNGDGIGDVLGQSFELTLPVAGWLNGEITISDERFIASSSYKYFIGVDEANRDEYAECSVQAKDIRANGFVTFACESTPSVPITVSILRLEFAANN